MGSTQSGGDAGKNSSGGQSNTEGGDPGSEGGNSDVPVAGASDGHGGGSNAGSSNGSAGSDAGTGGCGSVACPQGADIRVTMAQERSDVASWVQADIFVRLVLRNHGVAPLDLSRVTLRYWFTKEASGTLFGNVDYCSDCVAAPMSFVETAHPGADHYASAAFSSGALPADPDETLVLLLRIDTDQLSDFNEADDWSCNAANMSMDQVPWDRVTIYQDNVLIAGKEPG